MVETRFYFRSDDGQLVASRCFRTRMSIRVNLYFDEYQSVDGQMLPHRIQVRYGDRLFATWTLDEFKLAARSPGKTA